MTAKLGQRGWGHIRKLSSGRFQASFVGPDLLRYNGPLPFDSKERAEGWLSREHELIQRAAYDGSRWVSPAERDAKAAVQGETLDSYGKRWIAGRNIKPRTRIEYSQMLVQNITPVLGHVGIGALTSDAVNRWHSKTLTDKPTARKHTYSLLHAICATAVEDGLLERNPCAIKRAMTVTRKREPVILTVAELAAVAEAIKPDRFKALVLLSAWAALRFGEVTELRRKDITDGCESITVSRGVTHRGGCNLDTTKTATIRTVVLPNAIRADIKHHLDTFVSPEPDALLFVSRGKCSHLSQNVFREALNTACTSINREGVTPHALRHLGATLATRAGGSLAEVQARLGHVTVRAAMLYQHAASGRDAEIAAALSAMIDAVD